MKRHTLPIPTLEQLTSKLSSATRFSKLDASFGFYQTPLDEASSKMTMFLAPFVRKRFLRLPMEISHAPEYFQQKMEMLDGLPGVVVYMDDTAVFREDTSHDKHLEALTRRINESGLKLNRKKGEFRKCEIRYLGMQLSSSGISMDEEKLEAIQQPTSHRSQPLTSAEQRRTQPTADQPSEVQPHLYRRCRSTEDVERTAAHTSSHQPHRQQRPVLAPRLTARTGRAPPMVALASSAGKMINSHRCAAVEGDHSQDAESLQSVSASQSRCLPASRRACRTSTV